MNVMIMYKYIGTLSLSVFFLQINFDLWKSEDGGDSDEDKRDVMKDYPGMYDQLQKEEMGYRKGSS